MKHINHDLGAAASGKEREPSAWSSGLPLLTIHEGRVVLLPPEATPEGLAFVLSWLWPRGPPWKMQVSVKKAVDTATA